MILTETVIVKSNNKYFNSYLEKGYKLNEDGTLTVKVSDLPRYSGYKVLVQCDKCKKEKIVPYGNYLTSIKHGGWYACEDCISIKRKEQVIKKYGVEYTLQVPEIRETIKQTNLEKYGYENPYQSPEIQEKVRQTNLIKYGTENPFSAPEIIDKIHDSILEKYGVDYAGQIESGKIKSKETSFSKYGTENPAQSEIVKEKIRTTNLIRYGTENAFKNPDIQEKARKTMYKNSTVPTSKQQKYLYNLYSTINPNAKLNYPIGKIYSGDIVIDNIDIEADFGGHDLSVKLGTLTQEEFDQKQLVRDVIIKRSGYKIMRIISRHDKLPSDEILLAMLSAARTYFTTTEHTWIEYDIDQQTVRNALNKEGVFFDYGELRTIKQAA